MADKFKKKDHFAHNIDIEVGANLKKMRLAQDTTLPELAERLHCDVETIEAYESGAKRVDAETLRHIAELLNVSVSSFFNNHLSDKNQFLGDLIHAYIHEDMLLPDNTTATEVLAHLRSYLSLSAKNRRFINKTTTLLKAGF